MKTYSFPVSRRLRTHKEYVEVYGNGKKFHTNQLIVYVKCVSGSPQRVGFAVSKKVGNAVMRNRIKRLLRDFFRLNSFCLLDAQIVVVVKSCINPLNLDGVRQQLWPLYCRLAGIKSE